MLDRLLATLCRLGLRHTYRGSLDLFDDGWHTVCEWCSQPRV